MNVLRFNDKFDDIIEEPTSYWKTIEEVPEHIIEFINKTSDSIPLENNNKKYCPICNEEITKEYKCPKCLKIFSSKDKLTSLNDYIYYYIFDISNNNIILYLICEYINYKNTMSFYPYKTNKISIDAIYQILPTKIINVKENTQTTYKELEKIIEKFKKGKKINDIEFNLLDNFFLNSYKHQYIYTNNLDDLKQTTLYKYSNIWTLKKYLKNNYFTLSSLTFYPIYYKEFEYLLKLGLYDLAVSNCFDVKYKGSFKNTFGIEKKYYKFMKEININYSELKSLELYPTTDINILNFVNENYWLVKSIQKYTGLDKVLNYLKEQNLNINNLHEYNDYLRCSEEMKLDLKDHTILFPKHFIEEHDKITKEMIIAKDPLINNKIKRISNILVLNKYEDDKYIIFPANSINSLIEESSEQSNCVRTYCNLVSNNECQIYFMRHKNNIKKSFVTIEVRNNKVVQAKTRFNKEVTKDVMNIILKWEQTLIPLNNE